MKSCRGSASLRLPPTSTAATFLAAARSRGEWAVGVFAAVVQQGAFISIPLYLGTSLPVREEQNQLNTAAVALSAVALIGILAFRPQPFFRIAWGNFTSVAFLGLALFSVIWSIH